MPHQDLLRIVLCISLIPACAETVSPAPPSEAGYNDEISVSDRPDGGDVYDGAPDASLPPLCVQLLTPGCNLCRTVTDMCARQYLEVSLGCPSTDITTLCLCALNGTSEACRDMINEAARCGLRACGH